jgi:hypothetical protein
MVYFPQISPPEPCVDLALRVPSVGWVELALRMPILDAVSRSQPISKLASNICLNIGISGES